MTKCWCGADAPMVFTPGTMWVHMGPHNKPNGKPCEHAGRSLV